MVGEIGASLAVFALSWYSLLLAGLGNAIDGPANIAVSNNSVVYLTSVTGSTTLRIGCLPEDRMPSIPEPYRSQQLKAKPEPIMTLFIDWLDRTKEDPDAHSKDKGAETETRIEIVLGENHRVSSTWAINQVKTSAGGYSLSTRGKAAANLLADIIRHDSLVIEITLLDEALTIPFHLAGLDRALELAITCLP